MTFIERRSRPQRTMVIVDVGIGLIVAQGRHVAAQFMAEAGVPLAVICRVADEQGRRRPDMAGKSRPA